ncbi:MAG: purine-nucleoside phosphorylase [Desulfovibrio sp.]|nr:purine-nucleoside phosphorylase [Desulfovibrio sp.]
MQNWQDVQIAASAFAAALSGSVFQDFIPETGVVLGTGLSSLARSITKQYETVRIPFSQLPGFPIPAVESHAGAFLVGEISGLPAIIQQGRCHLYEGFGPERVCMGVRLMAVLGVKNLVITNAAGALNPNFESGTIMNIADIINNTGVSPLEGPNDDARGERFPDMSEPMDRELRELASRAALRLGIKLEAGVYLGTRGPQMETPAETRMFRSWGADAVGMSSVLEIIAARHCGLKTLGFSCLTNKNLPDCMEPAPLSRVLATAARCGEDLARLIREICANLAQKKKKS